MLIWGMNRPVVEINMMGYADTKQVGKENISLVSMLVPSVEAFGLRFALWCWHNRYLLQAEKEKVFSRGFTNEG